MAKQKTVKIGYGIIIIAIILIISSLFWIINISIQVYEGGCEDSITTTKCYDNFNNEIESLTCIQEDNQCVESMAVNVIIFVFGVILILIGVFLIRQGEYLK